MNLCPRGCAAILGLFCTSAALALPAVELQLPSCVAGSPALRLPAAAPQARLDTADGIRFHEAAQARYALYQSSGRAPAQVLLLRRGPHWQYVTLWPRGAAGVCFSAVFAADGLDFTPGWIAKYRPRAVEVDD